MPKSLSTVRTEVLGRLGDSTNVIWSNAEIDRYIQEGYDELVFRAESIWKRAYSNDVASTATYTLPSDFLKMDRVIWNQRRIPPVAQRELADYDSRYTLTKGPVRAWSLELDGIATLRKYPIPSTTPSAGADVNNTRIEYFSRGAALSGDSSTFEIPDRYVKYVRHFAMYRAMERNGPGQDLSFAGHWRERYESGVARLISRKQRAEVARIAQFGERKISIGPPPRPRLPITYGKIIEYP